MREGGSYIIDKDGKRKLAHRTQPAPARDAAAPEPSPPPARDARLTNVKAAPPPLEGKKVAPPPPAKPTAKES